VDLTLRLTGADLQVLNAGGQVLAARPLVDTTGVVVNGAANATETLKIDYLTGGFFTVPDGVQFNAGSGGTDALSVVGTGPTTAVVTPAVTGTAMTVTSGGQTAAITATGLEADVGVTKMAVLNVRAPGAADVLTLASPGGQNRVSVSSGGAAQLPVTFSEVPGVSLTGGAGHDQFDLRGWTGATSVTGGAGRDTVLTKGEAPGSVSVSRFGNPGDYTLKLNPNTDNPAQGIVTVQSTERVLVSDLTQTGTLITPAAQTALVNGLRAVGVFADNLSQVDELGRPLPLTDAHLTRLAGLKRVIDDLANRLDVHLSQIRGTGTPTHQDVLVFLRGQSILTYPDATLGNVTATLNGVQLDQFVTPDGSSHTVVRLSIATSRTSHLSLADRLSSDLGLTFPAGGSSSIDLTTTATMDFAVGLAPAGTSTAIDLNKLQLAATANGPAATNAPAAIGFLGVRATGTISLTADVPVLFVDPTPDDGTRANELDPPAPPANYATAFVHRGADGRLSGVTDNYAASFDTTVDGAMQFFDQSTSVPASAYAGRVVVGSNDFLSAPLTIRFLKTDGTPHPELQNFTYLTPHSALGMLQQLQAFLAEVGRSSVLNKDVPFADAVTVQVTDPSGKSVRRTLSSLGDVLDFGRAFEQDVLRAVSEATLLAGAPIVTTPPGVLNSDARFTLDVNGKSIPVTVTAASTVGNNLTAAPLAALAADVQAAIRTALTGAGLASDIATVATSGDLLRITLRGVSGFSVTSETDAARVALGLGPTARSSLSPVFVHAQGLATLIGQSLSAVTGQTVTVVPRYDAFDTVENGRPRGNELTFRLDWSHTFTDVKLPAGFGTGIGDFTDIKPAPAVVVQSPAAGEWAVRFTGPLGRIDVAAITADASKLTGGTITITETTKGSATADEVQTIRTTATGGTFTLTFNGQTTASLPYNATALAVQEAIQALPGIRDLSALNVTATTTTGLTFGVELTATPQSNMGLIPATAAGLDANGQVIDPDLIVTSPLRTRPVPPIPLGDAAASSTLLINGRRVDFTVPAAPGGSIPTAPTLIAGRPISTAVQGELSADARFTLTIGSTTRTVTVLQVDTLGNRSPLDSLVADVQAAVDDALDITDEDDPDRVRVFLDAAGRLQFAGPNAPTGTNAGLTITTTSTAAQNQLGFGTSQTVAGPKGTAVTLSAERPIATASPGELSGNATFTLAVNGDDPVTVTVTRQATLDNEDPLDALVADVQRAVKKQTSQVTVTRIGRHLAFTSTAALEVSVAEENPAATQLGLGDQQASISVEDGKHLARVQAALDVRLAAIGLAPGDIVVRVENDQLVYDPSGPAVFDVQAPAEVLDASPVPANGVLGADAHFDLILNDADVAHVTVPNDPTNATRLPSLTGGAGTGPIVHDGEFALTVVETSGLTRTVLVTVRAADAAVKLGFPTVTSGEGQITAATALTAAGSKLTADATFTLSLDSTQPPAGSPGGSPVAVTLFASETADNVRPRDLVADLNAALARAGLGDRVFAELSPSGRVRLTAVDPATGAADLGTWLTVSPAAYTVGDGSAAQLQAGLQGALDAAGVNVTVTVAANRTVTMSAGAGIRALKVNVPAPDPEAPRQTTGLGLRDGDADSPIRALAEDVQAAVNAALPAGYAAGDVLVYTLGDVTADTARIVLGAAKRTQPPIASLRVVAERNDPAVTRLGFDDLNPPTTLGPVELLARAKSDNFFLRDTVLSGRMTASRADMPIVGTYGFVGFDGTADVNVTADPVRLALVQPPGAYPRLRLGELRTAAAEGTLGDPAHATVTRGSSALVNLDLVPSGNLLGPTVRSAAFTVGNWAADDTAVSVDTRLLGDLTLFRALRLPAVLSALGRVTSYLGSLDDPRLDASLPLINQSVRDLIDYAGRFDDLVTAIGTVPAPNLQALTALLKGALGLPFDSDLVAIRLDNSVIGKPALRLDLLFQTAGLQSYSLDLDLEGLLKLSASPEALEDIKRVLSGAGGGAVPYLRLSALNSGGRIDAAARATLRLSVGFDLSTPATAGLSIVVPRADTLATIAATEFTPTTPGELSGDSTFVLTVTGPRANGGAATIQVPVTVPRSLTAGAADSTALAAIFQARVQDALRAELGKAAVVQHPDGPPVFFPGDVLVGTRDVSVAQGGLPSITTTSAAAGGVDLTFVRALGGRNVGEIAVDASALIKEGIDANGNTIPLVPSLTITTIQNGGAGFDEVQRLTIDATGGTFTLRFNGAETDPLPFNATAEAIAEALAALPDLAAPAHAWTVTFTGAHRRLAIADEITADLSKLFQADGSAPRVLFETITPGSSTADEVRAIQVDATGGTFTLTFRGQTTAPIPFDATGEEIAAALGAVVGGPTIKVFARTDTLTSIRLEADADDPIVTQLGFAVESESGARVFVAGSAFHARLAGELRGDAIFTLEAVRFDSPTPLVLDVAIRQADMAGLTTPAQVAAKVQQAIDATLVNQGMSAGDVTITFADGAMTLATNPAAPIRSIRLMAPVDNPARAELGLGAIGASATGTPAAIVAPTPMASPRAGLLSAPATFTLRLQDGAGTVSLPIQVDPDGANADDADLLDDVQQAIETALVAAGRLATDVAVSLSADGHLTFTGAAGVTALRITATGGNPVLDQLGFAADSTGAGGNQSLEELRQDVQAAVDAALAETPGFRPGDVLVGVQTGATGGTLRFGQRGDLGFGPVQQATGTPAAPALIQGLAPLNTPRAGVLSGRAEFTLAVTTAAGVKTVTVDVVPDAANVSNADLVADIQAALNTKLAAVGLSGTVTVGVAGENFLTLTGSSAVTELKVTTAALPPAVVVPATGRLTDDLHVTIEAPATSPSLEPFLYDGAPATDAAGRQIGGTELKIETQLVSRGPGVRVTGAGTPANPFLVTFINAFGRRDVAPLQADTIGLVKGPGAGTVHIATVQQGSDAQNEVQSIVIDATGGAFFLSFEGETTDAILVPTTAARLESALIGLDNLGAAFTAAIGPVAFLGRRAEALLDADGFSDTTEPASFTLRLANVDDTAIPVMVDPLATQATLTGTGTVAGNGRLSGDASFNLQVTRGSQPGVIVNLPVTVPADATNQAAADLVADVQAALDAVLPTKEFAAGDVVVSLVGNRLRFAASPTAGLVTVGVAGVNGPASAGLGLGGSTATVGNQSRPVLAGVAPVSAPNGVMSAKASFVLILTRDGLPVLPIIADVPRDTTNTSLAALVADIQAALNPLLVARGFAAGDVKVGITPLGLLTLTGNPNASITSLRVTTGETNTARTQLGLPADGTSLNDNGLTDLVPDVQAAVNTALVAASRAAGDVTVGFHPVTRQLTFTPKPDLRSATVKVSGGASGLQLPGTGQLERPLTLTLLFNTGATGDGRHALSESAEAVADTALAVQAGLSVNLPLFNINADETAGGVALHVPDLDAVFKSQDPVAPTPLPDAKRVTFADVPDFSQAEVPISLTDPDEAERDLIQDPGAMFDGLESYFDQMQAQVNDQSAAGRLPLIGDAAQKPLQFISDLKESLLGSLKETWSKLLQAPEPANTGPAAPMPDLPPLGFAGLEPGGMSFVPKKDFFVNPPDRAVVNGKYVSEIIPDDAQSRLVENWGHLGRTLNPFTALKNALYNLLGPTPERVLDYYGVVKARDVLSVGVSWDETQGLLGELQYTTRQNLIDRLQEKLDAALAVLGYFKIDGQSTVRAEFAPTAEAGDPSYRFTPIIPAGGWTEAQLNGDWNRAKSHLHLFGRSGTGAGVPGAPAVVTAAAPLYAATFRLSLTTVPGNPPSELPTVVVPLKPTTTTAAQVVADVQAALNQALVAGGFAVGNVVASLSTSSALVLTATGGGITALRVRAPGGDRAQTEYGLPLDQTSPVAVTGTTPVLPLVPAGMFGGATAPMNLVVKTANYSDPIKLFLDLSERNALAFDLQTAIDNALNAWRLAGINRPDYRGHVAVSMSPTGRLTIAASDDHPTTFHQMSLEPKAGAGQLGFTAGRTVDLIRLSNKSYKVAITGATSAKADGLLSSPATLKLTLRPNVDDETVELNVVVNRRADRDADALVDYLQSVVDAAVGAAEKSALSADDITVGLTADDRLTFTGSGKARITSLAVDIPSRYRTVNSALLIGTTDFTATPPNGVLEKGFDLGLDLWLNTPAPPNVFQAAPLTAGKKGHTDVVVSAATGSSKTWDLSSHFPRSIAVRSNAANPLVKVRTEADGMKVFIPGSVTVTPSADGRSATITVDADEGGFDIILDGYETNQPRTDWATGISVGASVDDVAQALAGPPDDVDAGLNLLRRKAADGGVAPDAAANEFAEPPPTADDVEVETDIFQVHEVGPKKGLPVLPPKFVQNPSVQVNFRLGEKNLLERFARLAPLNERGEVDLGNGARLVPNVPGFGTVLLPPPVKDESLGLGINLDAGVAARIGWNVEFGFGFSKEEKFFLDTSKTNEITLDARLGLASNDLDGPAKFQVRLGIGIAEARDQFPTAPFSSFLIDLNLNRYRVPVPVTNYEDNTLLGIPGLPPETPGGLGRPLFHPRDLATDLNVALQSFLPTIGFKTDDVILAFNPMPLAELELRLSEALGQSLSLGEVTVRPVTGQSGKFDVTFGGKYARQGVALLGTDTAALAGSVAVARLTSGGPTTDEVQRIDVQANAGTYVLTFLGKKSAPIKFDATAEEIAAAINGLANMRGMPDEVAGPNGAPRPLTAREKALVRTVFATQFELRPNPEPGHVFRQTVFATGFVPAGLALDSKLNGRLIPDREDGDPNTPAPFPQNALFEDDPDLLPTGLRFKLTADLKDPDRDRAGIPTPANGVLDADVSFDLVVRKTRPGLFGIVGNASLIKDPTDEFNLPEIQVTRGQTLANRSVQHLVFDVQKALDSYLRNIQDVTTLPKSARDAIAKALKPGDIVVGFDAKANTFTFKPVQDGPGDRPATPTSRTIREIKVDQDGGRLALREFPQLFTKRKEVLPIQFTGDLNVNAQLEFSFRGFMEDGPNPLLPKIGVDFAMSRPLFQLTSGKSVGAGGAVKGSPPMPVPEDGRLEKDLKFLLVLNGKNRPVTVRAIDTVLPKMNPGDPDAPTDNQDAYDLRDDIQEAINPVLVKNGFREGAVKVEYDAGLGQFKFVRDAALDPHNTVRSVNYKLVLGETKFLNISIDLGSFIGDTLGPIFKQMGEVVKPFDWLIGDEGLLTRRLPVLSDLAGRNTSLLDLSSQFGTNKTAKTLQALQSVRVLTNAAGVAARDAQGNRMVVGSVKVDPAGGNQVVAGAPGGANRGDKTLAEVKRSGPAQNFFANSQRGAFSLSIPLLSEPKLLYDALTIPGKVNDLTLVTLGLPHFEFNFQYEQRFNVIGPLFATLGGFFSATIDMGVGFDMSGVGKFERTGNFLDVLDGFFLSDREGALGTGADRPELSFTGGIVAGAELNLGVGSAGVQGGITASIDFNLDDPNNDGRVRFSEMIQNINANDGNPAAIFDIGGRIAWFFRAYVEMFGGLVRYSKDLGGGTIFEFAIPFKRLPVLAATQAGGVLVLNTGALAANRIHGNVNGDAGDAFVVRSESTNADGSANLLVQLGNASVTYAGIFRLEAAGGVGNDSYDFRGVTAGSLSVQVSGGGGNDTMYGGAGNYTFFGDDGNDLLVGGTGADVLDGGAGDDALAGAGGNDRLVGAAGIDTLDGGADADRLDGGEGDDQLRGGTGDDVYAFADAWGDDRVDETSGHDTFDLSAATAALTFRVAAFGPVEVTGVTDLTNRVVTTGFPIERLVGGRGADKFNVSAAGAGGLTLDGGRGSDTYVYDLDTLATGPVLRDSGPNWNTDTLILNASAAAERFDVSPAGLTVQKPGSPAVALGYAGGGIEALEANGKGGADVVNVSGTDPRVRYVVNAGEGDDTVNIGVDLLTGAPTNLAGIRGDADVGPLVVRGNAGRDLINVFDQTRTDGTTGFLTPNRLLGFGMRSGVKYLSFEDLELTLGSGNDKLTIEGTHASQRGIPGVPGTNVPRTTNVDAGAGDDTLLVKTIAGDTTVQGRDGDDTFTVSDDLTTTDQIFGTLNIDGGSSTTMDVLTVDDSEDRSPNTGALTTTAITGLDMGGDINFTAVEELTVRLGQAPDLFDVRSTLAATPVTLHGGGGDDRLSVGSLSESLIDIQGGLDVDGGAGANQLVVTDAGGTTPKHVVLTDDRILGFAPVTIHYQATGGHFDSVIHDPYPGSGILLEGSRTARDAFLVKSTLAGSTTAIAGGGGADVFYAAALPPVGVPGGPDTFPVPDPITDNGDLGELRGRLRFVGPTTGAPSRLYVNDHGYIERANYTVNSTMVETFVDPTNPTPSRTFAGIDYQGLISDIRVDGTDDVNVFNARPSKGTKFVLEGNLPVGGAPIVGGGDFIRLDTNGTTGRKLHITSPGHGFWRFTSKHPDVVFESMERFNHVDLAAYQGDKGKPSTTSLMTVRDAENGVKKFGKLTYEPTFRGPVRWAQADMNWDGLPDLITVTGAGRTAELRIFDGTPDAIGNYAGKLLTSFAVFPGNVKTGAFVAAGDVNHDGAADVVIGADAGWSPLVAVWDGLTALTDHKQLVDSFMPYPATFRGGVRVAVGDVDETSGASTDYTGAEIITAPGKGMAPIVGIYSIAGDQVVTRRRFNAYPPTMSKAGLFVAVGDYNGDRVRDVIVSPGAGVAPKVHLFSGVGLMSRTGLAEKPTAVKIVSPATYRGGVAVVPLGKDGGNPFAVEWVDLKYTLGPK
jgi:hypothetical protein